MIGVVLLMSVSYYLEGVCLLPKKTMSVASVLRKTGAGSMSMHSRERRLHRFSTPAGFNCIPDSQDDRRGSPLKYTMDL